MYKSQNILYKKFYEREATIVARDLLGKYLIRKINGVTLLGKIMEVEAYLSSGDSAAHSSVGQTTRNKSLFGPSGCAYIHKMHGWNLLDLVVRETDNSGSVLIRALEPISGIDVMKKFRKTQDTTNLTNGPGKVCEALNITYDFDGIDITHANSPIYVVDSKETIGNIMDTPRIGISKSKDLRLRFVLEE